jgi:hypothetical protein
MKTVTLTDEQLQLLIDTMEPRVRACEKRIEEVMAEPQSSAASKNAGTYYARNELAALTPLMDILIAALREQQ